MTRVGRVAAVVSLVLAGSVVAASPAGAHAHLVGSNPSNGASLTTAPTKVTLRYDENVRDSSVVIVKAPDGKRVDSRGTTVADDTASVRVSVRLAGRYTVAYRVISADGHPISGTTAFSFHGPDAVAASSSDQTSASSDSGSRSGLLVGGGAVLVLLVAGGLLFGRRARRSPAGDGSE